MIHCAPSAVTVMVPSWSMISSRVGSSRKRAEPSRDRNWPTSARCIVRRRLVTRMPGSYPPRPLVDFTVMVPLSSRETSTRTAIGASKLRRQRNR